MSRPIPPRWWTDPFFGIHGIGGGDVALALLLSAFGVKSTSGLAGAPYPHQGIVAALAVLLMTVPVVVARRSPLAAAATLAAGAAAELGCDWRHGALRSQRCRRYSTWPSWSAAGARAGR